MKTRLDSLDYLRGLAAFAIMLYHFFVWSGSLLDSTDVLERIGVYGVSIFFLLSGLTLSHVYTVKILDDKFSFTSFYLKRFLRIYPLMWLVTLIVVLGVPQEIQVVKLVLNLTGLFGLVSWSEYYAPGVWSIGNELTYYLVFPYIIILFKKGIRLKILGLIIPLILFIYFAFVVIDPNISLSEQWRFYVNPLNNIALFVIGVYVQVFLKRRETFRYCLYVGIIGLFLYPVHGDSVNLVVGLNRIMLSMFSALIVIGAYNSRKIRQTQIHRMFTFIGERSYSIYLLHPIVWAIGRRLLPETLLTHHRSYVLFLLVSLTLYISHIVYKYFERKVLDLNFSNRFFSV